MKKHNQEAGDNSQQIIVEGDFHDNLTLAEATEVAELVAHKVVAEQFEKADALGLVRIGQLNDRILNRLESLDKLTAFADPAFMVLLRKAQIGAASSERDSDYDMLSELLAERVTRGDNRPIRAGIDRAVQVVDQLDTEALNALTVLQAASQFSPTSGILDQGLGILDALFAQFDMDGLPSGSEWIDHLDLLDAVRVSTLTSMKPFEEYYAEAHMIGYVSPGIPQAELEQMTDLAGLSTLRSAVVDHELKPGYVRVALPKLEQLQTNLTPFAHMIDVEQVVRVAREVFHLGEVDASLRPSFIQKLSNFPRLEQLRTWWDAIPYGVQATAVGRVLATANAKRCDVAGMLPPLD